MQFLDPKIVFWIKKLHLGVENLIFVDPKVEWWIPECNFLVWKFNFGSQNAICWSKKSILDPKMEFVDPQKMNLEN